MNEKKTYHRFPTSQIKKGTHFYFIIENDVEMRWWARSIDPQYFDNEEHFEWSTCKREFGPELEALSLLLLLHLTKGE